MTAYYLLQLAVCAASFTGVVALHFKQDAKHSASLERCSLAQDSSNEISLLARQSGCMSSSTPGVDFVSFLSRPSPLRLQRKRELRSRHRLADRLQDWGDGHAQGNGSIGDDCLHACQVPGYCSWCGSGNACCKKGSDDDPDECHGSRHFVSNLGKHECVEPPIDFGGHTFLQGSSSNLHDHDQLVVWISGYPRSGSSTLLSMVSATVDDNRAGGHTFSLFEPCHDGDAYDDWLTTKGCRQLLYGVSHCDFRGIKELWGWRDPHSSSNLTKTFSKDIAQDLCGGADIIAFKTVDWGHNLEEWSWLLNSGANMKVLDIVRDPRAIYASWKELEPFKSMLKADNFYTLSEICDHFAKNLDFKDSRVKRIMFEELMKNPKGVTRDVYKFLEQPFTSDQELWLQKTFNSKECPPPAPGMKGYTDCHTTSFNEVRGQEKWRNILTEDELNIFAQSESCQRVAKAYKYPRK